MRYLPFSILLAITLMALFSSCKEEKHYYVKNIDDSTPSITSYDVATFISQTGNIRYYIQTPVWEIYNNTPDNKYWRFPQGLELTQYEGESLMSHNISEAAAAMQDSILKQEDRNPADSTLLDALSHKLVERVMRCDSAYYTVGSLWQLDGNVVVITIKRDTFLTNQLFYDEKDHKIYSDSFVRILTPEREIEIFEGFVSNEAMTEYTYNDMKSKIKVKKQESTSSTADDEAVESTSERRRRTPIPERASRRNDQPEMYNF